MNKVCIKCNIEKEESLSFYKRSKSKGYDSTCKECTIARSRKNELARKEKDPELAKRKKHSIRLKSKYGLSLEEWDMMYKEQNGVCYLCFRENPKHIGFLYVDHDHKTGKIRKLLCITCNTFLGHIENNHVDLNRFIKYLKEEK